jgi:hypothetical protein
MKMMISFVAGFCFPVVLLGSGLQDYPFQPVPFTAVRYRGRRSCGPDPRVNKGTGVLDQELRLAEVLSTAV